MASLSDVTSKLVQRASNIPTATAVRILNDDVREDLRSDLYLNFPDTFTGEQEIEMFSPSALTAAAADPVAAGNVDDGNHRYKVSFVTSARESMAGDVSDVVNIEDQTVNGQIELTVIPTGGSDVTSRKVYRQFNGTGTFKLLTTIADNTTVAYTDNTANSSLGAIMSMGQDLASDFYSELVLFDGDTRVPLKRKSEATTSSRYFAWIDYTDSATDTSTQRINFDPDHPFTDNLRLVYRIDIDDVVSGGNLTYPTSLHARLLPILRLGLAFYYLTEKTGEDDHVMKLAERYETAKANLFSGGNVLTNY